MTPRLLKTVRGSLTLWMDVVTKQSQRTAVKSIGGFVRGALPSGKFPEFHSRQFNLLLLRSGRNVMSQKSRLAQLLHHDKD